MQKIVINDHLGINAELEKQMQHVIDTYQCEWKTTIESEEQLKRFRQFVNSDKIDGNIEFVTERDQIRPAHDDEKKYGVKIQAVDLTPA
jgi:nitrite reductase (NADH) large subunit